MKIRLRDVSRTFGETRAVDGVSLDVPDETQSLVLIGPSGGGKSTLLRLIGGLERPDPKSGDIEVDGEAIDFSSEAALLAHRRKNGFLFQQFNLFPHKSALQNIALPLVKVHGLKPAEAKSRAVECLERFGLADHIKKFPAQLSGGQQQRVALARAVAHEPALLILDEPTSALDPEMTAEVLEFIDELRAAGQEIVLSTHEMGFAREVADQVVFLAEGKVVEQGKAEAIFDQPENGQVERFLSRVMRY